MMSTLKTIFTDFGLDVTNDTIADVLKKFEDEGCDGIKIAARDNDGNINGLIVICGKDDAQAVYDFVSSLNA